MKAKSILLVEDNADDEMLTLRALRKVSLAKSVEDVRDVAIDVVLVNGSNHEIAWGATAGGLARVDALVPSAIGITTADGLPSDNLRTVVIDGGHVKYLGTTNGIVIYRGL